MGVQSAEWEHMTLQDCFDWVNRNCTNEEWPGDPMQPASCPKGVNAIAVQNGIEDASVKGMCRVHVCNFHDGPLGANGDIGWDCFYNLDYKGGWIYPPQPLQVKGTAATISV